MIRSRGYMYNLRDNDYYINLIYSNFLLSIYIQLDVHAMHIYISIYSNLTNVLLI